MSRKKTVITEITCDRCGATGESFGKGAFEPTYIDMNHNIARKDYTGCWAGMHVEVDLCSKCTDEFIKFLENTNKKEKA